MSLLLKPIIDWSLCICYLVHAQSAKYVDILLPHLSSTYVTCPHACDILTNEDSNKETKVIILEVKFELNINAVLELKPNHRTIGIAAI